jgi:hypothetical protein
MKAYSDGRITLMTPEIVRIWQHQLKKPARAVAKLERCLNK